MTAAGRGRSGSRYESGRSMPQPVRELLRLVHVERIDLTKVSKQYFDAIEHLKTADPDLYRSLRRAVRGGPTPEAQ